MLPFFALLRVPSRKKVLKFLASLRGSKRRDLYTRVAKRKSPSPGGEGVRLSSALWSRVTQLGPCYMWLAPSVCAFSFRSVTERGGL